MLTFRIHAGLVPDLLTSINMYPPLVMLGVDLGPAIVVRAQCPDESNARTHCAAQHAEAVGPFTNATSSCLEQGPNIPIPWEALVSPTIAGRTLVELNPSSTTYSLVFQRRCEAACYCWCAAV